MQFLASAALPLALFAGVFALVVCFLRAENRRAARAASNLRAATATGEATPEAPMETSSWWVRVGCDCLGSLWMPRSS